MPKDQPTQEQQVIQTIRKNGGYATLGSLYHLVDTSLWPTKTPDASIRRIVQNSKSIFRIQPGLWALEECRVEVLKKFDIVSSDSQSVEIFTHGYYQGLIVEIGKMKNYEQFTNRAKTVDVIWFNDRKMPDSFIEVEHSTDIQNSVAKFCDLQDFHSRFIIVAPQYRREQYDKVMDRTVFHDFRSRVEFRAYEDISNQYDLMCKLRQNSGCI